MQPKLKWVESVALLFGEQNSSRLHLIRNLLRRPQLAAGLGFERHQHVKLTIHDTRQVEYLRYHREHRFKD